MRNNPCKTELKVARSQRNRLRTIEKKLTDMSSEKNKEGTHAEVNFVACYGVFAGIRRIRIDRS
ncbi:hypothetical protein DRV60_21485 [Salmonella enterica subsp. enterica]|nr:hypothetical protein [Salmonella enterica subsp. enterica serovar Pomona]ECJ2879151.1 hypothetical protein [Salmonella enterica subsp. enterica serovar Pomona]EDH6018545.1 hypothetical protein [Salmonella enterica subsp. enterica serovar Pomona]EEJ7181593.1 hypothetical protein [Salmonella enterica subsp. enterica serovar Glostrup]